LYLLDEPESALSPKKQLELADLIAEASLSGDIQFIIVTHSPILLSMKNTDLLSFDGNGIIRTEYRNTEYFRIYRSFFNPVPQ